MPIYVIRKSQIASAMLSGLCLLSSSLVVPQMAQAKEKGNGATAVLWIDHLDLVPGDVDVQTSFNSTTSGLGSGLSGLMIKSTTTGDVSTSGGNKVVEKGVEVPPGFSISGVRICYELSAAGASGSFIDQIRLAQLQDPPSTALVLLDDATPQNASGPVCANSTTATTPINPEAGAVRLSLRVKFGSVNDKIVLRGLALNLVKTTKKAGSKDEDDQ
jgi:hypothetical protein